jgi:hydroxyacylglutathione hydrolase
MHFETFKTPGLAHNAYLLAYKQKGILIDPRRDVDEYVSSAQKKGINIEYVLETHRQEDFILGSAVMKDLLNVKVVGGDHEIFSHCDMQLKDGEEFEVENFRVKLLHTPGHTPESVSYAFYHKDKEECWAVFTGDALFVGDAGRTDLPDVNKTKENAGLLYDMIHRKILPLGPQTLLYPAHGAGSVCGGNIANFDESTLGFEESSNPVFTMTRDEFIEHKSLERIPRPPYFTLMEEINLKGGEKNVISVMGLKMMSPEEFQKSSPEGIIIDTRLPEAFAGAHIENSYSIWLGGLPVFGGYLIERDTPIYLVLEKADDLQNAYNYLTRIGMDNIKGVLTKNFESWRNAGLPIESSGTISPRQLKENLESYYVLDVREISEFEEEGHIPGAKHCFVGDLGKFIKNESFDRPIAVTCSVGHRASLAVSILLKAGFKDVSNILGGMTAWEKLGYEMKKKEKDQSFFYEIKKSKPLPMEQQLH